MVMPVIFYTACTIIFAIILSVGASLSGQSDTAPVSETVPVYGYQSYCSVPVDTSESVGSRFEIKKIGRPSEDIRSAHLIVSRSGQLRVQDIANRKQFALKDDRFLELGDEACPNFEAYGWQIQFAGNGFVDACSFSTCRSIKVRPRTLPFSVAAANNGIFVGTSFGEALLFRDGKWCRMVKSADVYTCDGSEPPIPDEPSNQFYSSTVFKGRTLIGEYPTGQIYEFDGYKVFLADLPPPPFRGRPLNGSGGYESQTLAAYCGNLFVGYWPHGQLFRFDGEKWHDVIRFFSSEPSFSPFQEAATSLNLVSNFFGQRVSSLIPYRGYLYVATSNKGDWNSRIQPDIPENFQEEYGTIYRISSSDCR